MQNFIEKWRSGKFASSTLALVLALCVLLSTFGGLAIFADSTEEEGLDIWGGQEATEQPKEAAGTEEDPILIENPEQFAYVLSNGGSGLYYKLTADIYLNHPDRVSWEWGVGLDSENYTPRMWYSNITFNGTLDGDGHTVYGLFMPYGTGSYYESGGQGLISKVKPNGAVTIKNLAIDKAYCTSVGYTSAFIGVAEDAATVVFENCMVGGDVVVRGHSASAFMATGKTNETTISITNSANLGTLEAKGTSAAYEGLVGDFWSGSVTINNSYNVDGYVYNKNNATNSANNYGTESSPENVGATTVAAENMKGKDVLYSADKMNLLGIGFTSMGTGKYPLPWIFSGKVMPDFWDGTTVAPKKGGEGTSADDAILIETPEELAYVIKTGGAGRYYKLANDIYLNHPDFVNWTTGTSGSTNYTIRSWFKRPGYEDSVSAGFSGTIDGAGHTIYGLLAKEDLGGSYFPETTVGGGLIPQVNTGSPATVKNLGIDNAYVNNGCNAAALIGAVYNEGSDVTVDSCYVGADVTVIGFVAAAFVGVGTNGGDTGTGLSSVRVTNSYNLGTLSAQGAIANGSYSGLVGDHWANDVSISNSYNATGAVYMKNSTMSNNYALEGSGDASGATPLSADKMLGADVLTNPLKMPLLGDEWTEMGDGNYPVQWIFSGKEKHIHSYDNACDTDCNECDEEREISHTYDNNCDKDCNVCGETRETSHVYDNEYDINCNICDEARDDLSYWNGTTVEPTKGGDGLSEREAILIETPQQFAYVFQNGGNGKYYKLTDDIYLNNVDAITWSDGIATTGYTPNVWTSATTMNATIDGDGHVVYGLYVNNTNSGSDVMGSGAGLISNLQNGVVTITKLGIDKAYVCGTNASAFVGYAGQPNWDTTSNVTLTINQCYVGSNVKVTGHNAGAFLGSSLIATAVNANISSCYNQGTIEGTLTTGLFGQHWGSSAVVVTVSTSYNTTGPITKISAVTSTHNYALANSGDASGATPLSDTDMQGINTKNTMEKLGQNYVTTEKYPQLVIFMKEALDPEVNQAIGYKGAGTEADPYLITNADELYRAVGTFGGGYYYKLTNDIYLNDIDKIDWWKGSVKEEGYEPREWFTSTSLGTYDGIDGESNAFYGTIDGDGFAVYGIYYPNANESLSAGLIPAAFSTMSPPPTDTGSYTYKAVVKNLTIKESSIGSAGSTGAFVGYMPWGAVVELDSCSVDTTAFIRSWSYVESLTGAGGFVGVLGDYSILNINDCIMPAYMGPVYSDNTITLPPGIRSTWGFGALFFGNESLTENTYVNVSNTIAQISGTSGPYVMPNLATVSMSNVYVDLLPEVGTWDSGIVALGADKMKGPSALSNMSGLDNNIWYAATSSSTYPMLKIIGRRGGDVDMDGMMATTADLAALRQLVLGVYTDRNLGDINGDGTIDILDVVYLNNNKKVIDSIGAASAQVLGKVLFRAKNFVVDSNTAIVYAEGNTYAQNAANEIYGYYQDNGVNVMLPATLAAESATTVIYVGVGAETADDIWSIQIDGDGLYFTATDGGYAMLAQYYTSLPLREGKVWTASSAAANFGNEFSGTKTFGETTYTYVWGDEFNTSAIDNSKWLYSEEASRMGQTGYDMGISSASDTIKIVSDENESFMRLRAYKSDSGKYIVPASLQTTQKMAYKYGYVEIRAKIPTGYGAFPSFWLMSNQEKVGEWENKGPILGTDGDNTTFTSEIDVFEYSAVKDADLSLQNYLHSTSHMWFANASHGSLKAGGKVDGYKSDVVNTLSTEYHIIGFKWDENGTTMYLDGKVYAQFTFDASTQWRTSENVDIDYEDIQFSQTEAPAYKDPHVLIFNNHLYTPLTTDAPSRVLDVFSEYNYDIDYVRLYQTADCELYTGVQQQIEQQSGLN